MSVRAMAVVWESDLPQREKLVLLAYADHADHEGGSVFPSVGRIAWKTGYSERSVQRITKALTDKKYLLQEGASHLSTNLYRIPLDDLPRLPQYTGGDKLSGAIYGGDSLSGARGDKLSEGGDKIAEGGDKAMSPKPSIKPSTKPSEKKSRKRDPRLSHPAIIVYREIARLHVPIPWRDKVVQVVDDAEKWGDLVRDWIGYGWNKQNVKGMLEAYQSGGIKTKNGKQHPDLNAWDRVAAELEAEHGK